MKEDNARSITNECHLDYTVYLLIVVRVKTVRQSGKYSYAYLTTIFRVSGRKNRRYAKA